MTEGRIQDWIRYVQDRAEHVEESQETSDSSTQESSTSDESSSHNTSQSARQFASQHRSPSSQNGQSPSRPASSSLSSARPATSREPSVSRESSTPREAPTPREGRVLPSLTAQAVRRSVARARSLAANPQPAENTAPPDAVTTAQTVPAESVCGEHVASSLETPTLGNNAIDDAIAQQEGTGAVFMGGIAEAALAAPRTGRRGRRSRESQVRTEEAIDENGIDGKVRQRVRQRPETRAQMLDRLMNPTISLYEASVLLDVCAATVRRYTNSGVLPHVRTEGGQRRFRLRDVLALLQEQETKKS